MPIQVDLPNITEDKPLPWLDNLVRELNRNDIPTGGYGRCLNCGGYHTWDFGVVFGCIPAKEQAVIQ